MRTFSALKTHPDVDTTWTDEDFFQNARRILIAEMQKVVYGEYLPAIMGSASMANYGLTLSYSSAYNSNLDPSITNSFATAGYRFGHTMIQGLIKMYSTTTWNNLVNLYHLSDRFFDMTNYESAMGKGMEEIIMGLTQQQSTKCDRHFTTEVTNKLFANQFPFPGKTGVGEDLVARNIQRGRDHGLPSYAAFYENFAPVDPNAMDCWAKKPTQIPLSSWNLLKKIYHHPHHIDLFVGGIAETPYNGGIMGATFQGIIGSQFKALKDGDRFFFTHAGKMNIQEYQEIMGRTFADIICDNTNYINFILPNVFQKSNLPKSCSLSKKLDVTKFKLKKFKGFAVGGGSIKVPGPPIKVPGPPIRVPGPVRAPSFSGGPRRPML